MKHKKLLSLLVLLLTAAPGVWADDTVFDFDGQTTSVGTLTLGTNSVEAGSVKIHTNTLNINAIKMSSSYVYADGKYFTIKPATGSFKKGDKLSIAICFNNADDTKAAKAVIYADDAETLLYTTAQGINGRTSTDDPVVDEYVLTQDADILFIGRKGDTATYVTMLKVVRPDSETTGSEGEVTTNAAEGETTFTEASFNMPASDATVEYELVRDMSEQMTTTVGNAADGADYRIRIKKDGNAWALADISLDALKALITVHDALEDKDLAFFGQDAVCALQVFAVDDNDQPTGDAIDFANLTPGRYVAKAVAADGSDYVGETGVSNVIVLFQGYEVVVPAKEYITYYRDENLYADPETSADAQLYTITSVNGETATATEIPSANALMPFLVFNNSNVEKTFLLIPTETEINQAFASEFQGTLEGTTLSRVLGCNNYAFNGLQFVPVKNAIEVGPFKAWLAIPAGLAPSARAISLVFDNATGVKEVKEVREVSDDSLFDLNGRKVATPNRKGIYILNGKKVVVK